MPDRPLESRLVVVTRAAHQADDILDRLRTLGARPLLCPAIQIAPPLDPGPLESALARLEEYDWLIVTSANGAHALGERLAALKVPLNSPRRLRVGAIGPATASALEARGVDVSFVPRQYVAEGVLEEIGPVRGLRVLLPRADIARETLAAGLRERGARVDEVAAYRTVPGPGGQKLARRLEREPVDAVTFTSSSTVRFLLQGLVEAGLARPDAVEQLNHARVACIGPITAATARAEGVQVSAVAEEYTTQGLIEALLRLFEQPSMAH